MRGVDPNPAPGPDRKARPATLLCRDRHKGSTPGNPFSRADWESLAAVGVTPTVMTAIGLTIVIVGSIVIASDALRTGAILVVIGSLLDGLDGSVARASDSSPPGALFSIRSATGWGR